jgi:Uma2 family endonuclease
MPVATTPTLISVHEYLRTAYRPDCDYVDGEVLERNTGEMPHSRVQGFLVRFFAAHEDEWGIEALTEQRVQTGAENLRVPDVMVVRLPNLDERIVKTAPLLCVEVLSSEDRMSKVQERIDDYARMGVRSMWVVDPWRGTAFEGGADGVLREVKDVLRVAGTEIEIGVAAIFAELERLERRARRG